MLNLKSYPESDSTVRRKPIGQVTCPNCKVEMPRISLKTDEGNRFNECTYRCP